MIGEESLITPARTVALILWLVYIAAALLWYGLQIGIETFVLVGVLNGCIWFPEAMGGQTGLRVNKPSDPSFLSVVAWVCLLLPLAILIIQKLWGAELSL